MQTTKNYNLNKPDINDAVDITKLNENADKIDAELKNLNINKVEVITGKQLSTENYTTAEKTKLSGIAANANNYAHPTGDGNLHVPSTGTTNNGKVLKAGATAGSAGWVALVKADVGLGDADNTSDVNKPVSTAQQAALDLKAPIANPTFTGTVNGVTKAMVGLGSVDNTSDANKPVSTAQATALALKLDESAVANNLTETATGKALDATQGKLLNEQLTSVTGRVQTLEQNPTYPYESYMLFCANINTNSLDCAFGKGNEDKIKGIGLQLAMYAWFKGDSKIINPFLNLVLKSTLGDIKADTTAIRDISTSTNIMELINSCPYASAVMGTNLYPRALQANGNVGTAIIESSLLRINAQYRGTTAPKTVHTIPNMTVRTGGTYYLEVKCSARVSYSYLYMKLYINGVFQKTVTMVTYSTSSAAWFPAYTEKMTLKTGDVIGITLEGSADSAAYMDYTTVYALLKADRTPAYPTAPVSGDKLLFISSSNGITAKNQTFTLPETFTVPYTGTYKVLTTVLMNSSPGFGSVINILVNGTVVSTAGDAYYLAKEDSLNLNTGDVVSLVMTNGSVYTNTVYAQFAVLADRNVNVYPIV